MDTPTENQKRQVGILVDRAHELSLAMRDLSERRADLLQVDRPKLAARLKEVEEYFDRHWQRGEPTDPDVHARYAHDQRARDRAREELERVEGQLAALDERIETLRAERDPINVLLRGVFDLLDRQRPDAASLATLYDRDNVDQLQGYLR